MDSLKSLEVGFAALVEPLPFDVWLRDTEDRLVYANATAQRHWDAKVGRRPEETRIDSEALAVWKDNNRRALAGELVLGDVEYDHGRYFNLVAPIRLGGAIVGTVGINVDTGELSEFEARFNSREALLGMIADALPVAFGIRRVFGARIFHEMDNRYIRQLFGKTVEEMAGKCKLELGADPTTCERILERFSVARERHAAIDVEYEFASARGRRVFKGVLMPIDAPPNSKAGDYFAVIAQDVTEQRQLQRHLVHAERVGSLETLISAIGHEISNPLTYVMANVAYVRDVFSQREGEAPDDTRDALDAALEGLTQVSDLIKDLRAFAQGRDQDMGTVRIVDVVESVSGLISRELARRARLELALRPVPPVRGTGVKLAQVVLNLLKNALESFSGATDPANNRVFVETRSLGGRVELEVRDNGPGVPPEFEEKLFSPFASNKTEIGGTGLGLYVSRQVVEALGGTIEHVRPPQGGAAFVVSLPTA